MFQLVARPFRNYFKLVVRPRIPYIADQPQAGCFPHYEVPKTHSLHFSRNRGVNTRRYGATQFNYPPTGVYFEAIAPPDARSPCARRPIE